MLTLADKVFVSQATTISELSHTSVMALAEYFGLTAHLQVINAAQMGIGGRSSQRVLDIVAALSGDTYITGHGASNYLDHRAFERAGISVQYMQYRCKPYPQVHGDFTPYVSSLDLVANCGRDGARFLQSTTVEWKEFVHEST